MSLKSQPELLSWGRLKIQEWKYREDNKTIVKHQMNDFSWIKNTLNQLSTSRHSVISCTVNWHFHLCRVYKKESMCWTNWWWLAMVIHHESDTFIWVESSIYRKSWNNVAIITLQYLSRSTLAMGPAMHASHEALMSKIQHTLILSLVRFRELWSFFFTFIVVQFIQQF